MFKKTQQKTSENLSLTLKVDYVEIAVDDCQHQVAVMKNAHSRNERN